MEDCSAFALTTSSLTKAIMAVTKTMAWLESQTFSQACFLSDSVSMLMKVEWVLAQRHWLESMKQLQKTNIDLIFSQGMLMLEETNILTDLLTWLLWKSISNGPSGYSECYHTGWMKERCRYQL